jgi:hypothetical protein
MTRRLVVLLVAVLVALGVPAAAPASAAEPPLLTGIRASHHPGFDRVVFDFFGGLPANRSARYVPALLGDATGFRIPIRGRAILQVSFSDARGHTLDDRDTAPDRTTFALPNVLQTVQSGDGFEGVISYGVGLAVRQPFRLSTLSNPPRVVLDIDTAFTWTNRPVWFVNSAANVVSVSRPIANTSVAHQLMDRLYAGPTAGERANGLRFVASGSNGYKNLTISSGAVARVALTGGCSSGGSTVTVANEIMPTLRRLPNVDFVKVYDPANTTERPTGASDSIPTCLEP